MMKGIIKILLSSFLLINFYSAGAVDAPSSITIDEATTNSLTISWDPVPSALGYYVYYSTTTEGIISGDLGDLFEGTSATISNLEPGTMYYISLKSIDEDLNESDFSPESSFNTIALESEEFSLKLESVNTIYADEYELSFNNTLDTTPDLPKEVKIVNPADEFIEYEVIETTVLDNKLNIKLASPLETNTEYEMIVIEIFDIDANTILSGPNASQLFTTPNTFDEKVLNDNETNIDLNAATETGGTTEVTGTTETDTEVTNIDLNAATETVGTTEVTGTTETDTVSGNEQNTFETAQNAESLPQTGPAHWLLLAIALFFGLIGFTFSLKSRS